MSVGEASPAPFEPVGESDIPALVQIVGRIVRARVSNATLAEDLVQDEHHRRPARRSGRSRTAARIHGQSGRGDGRIGGQGPALVSILRQGSYLIASIHTALDDSQLVRFQHDPIDQVGRHRSRGVIIDVAALDVIDSFATSTLRKLAEMTRLRGARTVIVGIHPDVAFAMVELGMNTGTVETALDLEEGLSYLARKPGFGPSTHRSTGSPRMS